MSEAKPFRVEKFQGNDCVMGPNVTWLWMEPTVAEALICLNGAYADGAKSADAKIAALTSELAEAVERLSDRDHQLIKAESESTRLKAEAKKAADSLDLAEWNRAQAVKQWQEADAELTRLREREKAMTSPEMIERLAAIEHERWAGWMRHLFSKCVPGEQMLGVVCPSIPGWAEERWKRQMNTPYAELSEEEKESDRAEVRKTLAALSAEPKRISIVAALAHECPAPMCSGQPCKWDGKTYSAEPEGKEKGE